MFWWIMIRSLRFLNQLGFSDSEGASNIISFKLKDWRNKGSKTLMQKSLVEPSVSKLNVAEVLQLCRIILSIFFKFWNFCTLWNLFNYSWFKKCFYFSQLVSWLPTLFHNTRQVPSSVVIIPWYISKTI